MKNIAESLEQNKAVVVSMLKSTSHNYDRDLMIIEKFIEQKSYAKTAKLLSVKSHIVSRVVNKYAEKINMMALRQGWSECDLYSLGLNNRAVNCLKSAGIDTVSKLKSMSEVQLLKIPNLSKSTLMAILIAIK